MVKFFILNWHLRIGAGALIRNLRYATGVVSHEAMGGLVVVSGTVMQLARNSFFTLLSMALPFVVGIVTVPLYVSEIGGERYGALSIAWVLLGYFGQMDFGIGRALTQRISAAGHRRSPETARLIWSAIIGSTLFGIAGGAVVYGGATYFFTGPFQIDGSTRAELIASIWALAICNPVVAIAGVTSGALLGIERFRTVSFGTLVSNTGLQVFPLIAAYTIDHNIETLIVAALVARLLGIAIFATAVWRHLLGGERFSASRAEVRGLVNFGGWLMISAIVGPLMMFADRFVIGSYFGALAVAAYTIPFQVAYRLQIVPLAIAQVLFPRFAAESASDSVRRCGEYTAFISQIFAPIIIGAICLAGPLLHLWLGRHLDPRSVAIAQILLVGIWVNAVAQIPFGYIQARGNSRFTAILHLLELPIYIGMLISLGMAFGLNGLAAAFTLRCTFDCVLLIIKARTIDARLVAALGAQSLIVIAALLMGQAVTGWINGLVAAAALSLASAAFLILQVPDGIRARLVMLPGARLVPGLSRGLG